MIAARLGAQTGAVVKARVFGRNSIAGCAKPAIRARLETTIAGIGSRTTARRPNNHARRPIAKARAKRQTAGVQEPTGEFPVIKRRY